MLSEREVNFGIQVRESISWFFGGMSPPFLLVLTVLFLFPGHTCPFAGCRPCVLEALCPEKVSLAKEQAYKKCLDQLLFVLSNVRS